MNLVKPLVLASLLSMPAISRATPPQGLEGLWMLRVEDLQHQQKVSATIRFSRAIASSCMAGDWRKVVVETQSQSATGFFPISEPLAYTFQQGNLVLGRAEVCDGYLFLTGSLVATKADGDYSSVSIGGSSKIGYFTIERTNDR